MRYFTPITLIALSFLSIMACKKPDACFSVSDVTLKVGDTLEITNCSQNAHSYLYEFGDTEEDFWGGTRASVSSHPSPSHVYSTPGIYLITLTVSTSSENKSSKAFEVVEVLGADPEDLIGTWEKYKIEINPDEPGIPTVTDLSEIWDFISTDSVIADQGGNDEERFAYTLTDSATIILESIFSVQEFELTSATDNELIFRNDVFGGYAEHFFRPAE